MVSLLGFPRVFGTPLGGVGAGVPGGLTYAQRVAAIAPANLIQLLPLNETSGTNADDKSSQNNDGTYNANVVLNADTFTTGEPAPNFPANTSYVNLYSAAFNSDWNGGENSGVIFGKVSGSGIWTDSTLRDMVCLLVDGNNLLLVGRSTLSNRLRIEYRAGGTTLTTITSNDQSHTGWFSVGWTISKTGDFFRLFINGVQIDQQTGLGTWTGNLSTTRSLLGANTQTNGAPWSGRLAYLALWNTALTNAQMASASVV